MRIFWAILLVLWPALGWGMSVSAPLSAKQQQIVLLVQSPAGFVDEPLYREFWAEFSESFLSNPLARPMLSSALLESVGLMATYSEQLWVSVERSLASGRVERSEELVASRGRLQAMQREAGRLPEEVLADLSQTLRRGDELLRAAAAHRPVRLDEKGPEVVLTAALARHGRSQAQAAGVRLRQLFAPGFTPLRQIYRLAQASVEFTSPCALAQQLAEGQLSLQCLPQRDQVVALQVRPVSPAAAPAALAQCAASPAGIAPASRRWLGSAALEALMPASPEQEFAVRCTYRAESRVVLSLSVLAPRGQAAKELDELAGRVRPTAP